MAATNTERIGVSIDQLLTVDMNGRGVINELYDAAYRRHGRSPTMEAAERLVDTVTEGDVVVIATGFPIRPTYAQETDGPPGAASLARAVKVGLGAHPVVIAEKQAVEVTKYAAKSYGLNVDDFSASDSSDKADWSCTVKPFPTDPDAATDAARQLLAREAPSALIALERCSTNQHGEYHMMNGQNITEHAAKVEPLFERSDALTIGIGDGGNELGMGCIRDTVREVVPNAVECGCGCGGGIAAEVETDVVLPVTISNHGGHAIATAISYLLGDSILHPPEQETRALTQCGLAGAIDGMTGSTDGSCDGLCPNAHASVVELLNSLVAGH
jgi:hypothetical protein